jgi:hypothetical protein
MGETLVRRLPDPAQYFAKISSNFCALAGGFTSPREDIARKDRLAVIFLVRFIPSRNDRPFQRNTGKNSLAAAVSINSCLWQHAGFGGASDGADGGAQVAAESDIVALRKGVYCFFGIKNDHILGDLHTGLEADSLVLPYQWLRGRSNPLGCGQRQRRFRPCRSQ